MNEFVRMAESGDWKLLAFVIEEAKKKKKPHGPPAPSDIQKTIARYYDDVRKNQPGKSKEYAARVAWTRFCKYKNPDHPSCTDVGRGDKIGSPIKEAIPVDEIEEARRYSFGGMDPQRAYEESLHALVRARNAARKMRAPGYDVLMRGIANFGYKHAKHMERAGVKVRFPDPSTPKDLYNLVVGAWEGLRSAENGWVDHRRSNPGKAGVKYERFLDGVSFLMDVADDAMHKMRSWAQRSEDVDDTPSDVISMLERRLEEEGVDLFEYREPSGKNIDVVEYVESKIAIDPINPWAM